MTSDDRYNGFNFIVEIEGKRLARFRSVSGLNESAEEIEHSEPGESWSGRRLGSPTKYSVITLVNGFASSADLYSWYLRVSKGMNDRKRGSVIFADATEQQNLRWNFQSSWPTKWKGPNLEGRSNNTTVESLELTCEGLVRAEVGGTDPQSDERRP